ncbi:MAG: 2Fe-2S iron-sulfur cluster binding domain-containing protein [Spirochaetales bacterium]|jgi:Na+-transporting NADH:ubiquinone oxidoreductase subunit F|nr:2Fe-2S iron-sulfur cluster binding domain-containing protein [Exilispira sp.]NMC67418.1 2Fe-2S iron-sulfur cluster binding domain-containing protein [Spirochaetales bacterium]
MSIFFSSVLAVTSISSFLVILILVIDLIINNYPNFDININNKKTIKVEGGKPLLFALKDKEIFIPSACGGRGSCGYCKVKVLNTSTPYLPTELPYLTDEEKKNNIRLSCQIKVKSNLNIEIPESLFSVHQYETKVLSLTDLTYDIKQVTLEIEKDQNIDFKSGQYIQFEVPPYKLTSETVYRAYSIASAPSDNKKIELEIRLVPNGICTTYVHQYLKVGDKVKINGPYGEFYLRPTDAEIIFIAGGSGMAPIKSILLDMKEKGINRKATYFFGAKTKKDLFLLDLMEDLMKAMPNFKFIPALSDLNADPDWQGERGLITDVVDKYILSGENKEAYLCGSPGMINACIGVLTKKGIPNEKIYYDKFA